MRISDDERRARLARRHLLVGRHATGTASIADRMVALHSSDPASVYLAVAARDPGATIDSVAAELYDEPTVVRHHAMRRTLWVMTPDVAAAAHAACTRKIATAERRRSAKLFDRDERWIAHGVDRVVAAVAASPVPISTKQIGELLPDLAHRVTVSQGKNYEGTITAHTRLLLQAAFEGRIVRTRPAGTWLGTQYAWTVPDRWIDIDWDAHGVDAGHRELIRRWLWTFGPGTLDDIVWWTGSTKTAIGRALDELDADEVELDDGGSGYVLSGDSDGEAADHQDVPGAWVALLPGLDPTPMGWKRREWYLPAHVAERVVDRNGNIGPTVWIDGRVAGGWAQRNDGAIAHDADVPRSHRDLLETEIERLRSFVGDSRFGVRFPAPNQKSLVSGETGDR